VRLRDALNKMGWTSTIAASHGRDMGEALLYLASSFWAGAVHAATPGHGKTIAAAYIVGARGRPIDAVILGIFVTLSHTSGIVLVGALASIGSTWLMPQRVEAYLALVTGALVLGLGAWILWTQRRLLAPAFGRAHRHGGDYHGDHEHAHAHDDPEHAHAHGHDHSHHRHERRRKAAAAFAGSETPGHEVWHSHGWAGDHVHDFDFVANQRPQIGALLTLSIAGGLLPDPAALAILLAAISSGRLMLGLATVLFFSIGFAAALVLVGVLAAQLGRRVLGWLDGIWALRLQLATTLLIIAMGIVLTARAAWMLANMQS
jgi:nickel/cobalt exporter